MAGVGTVPALAWAIRHALRLPVVVLTGLDDEQMGLLAIRNGATDYLVKDQSLDTLLVRTIRYAIEREDEKSWSVTYNVKK